MPSDGERRLFPARDGTGRRFLIKRETCRRGYKNNLAVALNGGAFVGAGTLTKPFLAKRFVKHASSIGPAPISVGRPSERASRECAPSARAPCQYLPGIMRPSDSLRSDGSPFPSFKDPAALYRRS